MVAISEWVDGATYAFKMYSAGYGEKLAAWLRGHGVAASTHRERAYGTMYGRPHSRAELYLDIVLKGTPDLELGADTSGELRVPIRGKYDCYNLAELLQRLGLMAEPHTGRSRYHRADGYAGYTYHHSITVKDPRSQSGCRKCGTMLLVPGFQSCPSCLEYIESQHYDKSDQEV